MPPRSILVGFPLISEIRALGTANKQPSPPQLLTATQERFPTLLTNATATYVGVIVQISPDWFCIYSREHKGARESGSVWFKRGG